MFDRLFLPAANSTARLGELSTAALYPLLIMDDSSVSSRVVDASVDWRVLDTLGKYEPPSLRVSIILLTLSASYFLSFSR